MKRLLSIILCITTIFGLSGCMPKEQKKLKQQYEEQAIPIAVKHIEEKYGFTPKVIGSYSITEYDGTFYHVPTKNVRVKMEYEGKEFTTLLTGEDAEYLSDARMWYDVNNINNKFVISELDTNFIDTGITVAKASKLR